MNAVARLLVALMMTLPLAAQAESYRVDLIVFLDKAGGGEWGRKPAMPDLRRAIDPTDTAALSAAGIRVLPVEQFALNSEWQHLQNARRYQPLIRIAWIQNAPPESNGPALRLHWGEPLGGDAAGLLPVDGSVALTAGRYLHLDANLSYLQPANGGAIAFRLHEDRLMRRDELHHLDSPKLSILARVTKAGS